MMKKTYKSSLLALSVLASFTSCSESESLQQANLSKDKITFHATLDNSWKPLSPASSSRAAIAAATEKGPIVVPTPFGKPLYLHSVVQETADLQQAAATTRGAMQEGTTLDNTYYNNSFGVTAISTNNGTNTALFTNQKASKNNEDIWEIEDKTNSRWPFDALVSFHAYAPFNDATDGMWSVTTDAENVKTKIKYTAKSAENEIQSQPDIIVATNADSRSVSSDDKAVELKFSHALTAVNFAISKDLTDIFKTGATDGSKLKSITLSGIPNEGTCELTATEGAPQTPSQVWTFDTESDGAKKTGTYTFNLENKNITIGESYALTSNEDKNILMMIPQDLSQAKEPKLTFVLDIKGKGDQTFTFDLSNQTWLPGTSVTYKLSASAVNHLENAEVVFPNSWKDTEQAKYSYPKTDFAAGESIGLYVVNSNNTIEEANLKLTRDQDGKWMPENDNTKFLKLKNYKYFAYYPYNATAPTVDETKDKADEFFKDKISSLSVVADQSNEATLLAQDFQVAKGEIANDGSTLDFNMEHQVGLAVINLKSKTVAETRQFTKDTYKYYYGEGAKPTAGDYHDFNIELMASDLFEVNKPYKADDTGKKYLQIIPIGKSLKYKASNQTESEIPTGWGKMTGTDFSMSPSVTHSVVEKEFSPDYNREFYRLARLYANDKYDKGQIDEFSIPEITQYKLECWGASSWGADKTNYGGGYSYGNYTATDKNKILYVCAGGEGVRGGYNTNPNDFHVGGKGGYNGGGNAGNGNGYNGRYDQSGGGNGGGGATHIAFKSGLLAVFEKTYQDDVLLVAGGQGGATAYADYDLSLPIYSFGGGKTGAGVYAPFIPINDGVNPNGVNMGGHPVSQESHDGALFGRGGDGRSCINTPAPVYSGSRGGGGGGGGLWGGLTFKGTYERSDCSGGGGCGYVNSTHLQNPSTIEGNQEFLSPSRTKEWGHKGGGAAQISWLPSQLTRVK